MSNIVEKISQDVSNAVIYFDRARELIDTAEELFELEGKKIEHAARDLPKFYYRFGKMLTDFKAIEEVISLKVNAIESEHWRRYNEKYARALNTRDIQAYIAGEKDYVQMMELKFEVLHIKKKLEMILDGFDKMSWMIGHMTKLRVAELEDALLI